MLNSLFEDKILLITGGTGSFGSAVLNRFLNSTLKEIRIFSRDEKKQDEMRTSIQNSKVKFYLGDVRYFDSLNNAMKNVDFVFHAAALKQVPSCEFYPMEAIRTNVIGTENVINAALKNEVKKVIFLSTDKAVYPINSMGLTKALMEKLMIAKSRNLGKNDTVLCATRYGNVMASRGSVIPLFVDLIKNNKPITITDPNMTRFLMSLDESVELVLFAFNNGQQGDIFVQKSPACTINTLALALIEIFKIKVPTQIIGTRHGEKLYESLLSREEFSKAIDLDKYYRIPVDNRDLNYTKYFLEGETNISNTVDYTSHNTNQLDLKEVINVLLKLEFIKNKLSV
jgi:UDP-glucose 4-epimerase